MNNGPMSTNRGPPGGGAGSFNFNDVGGSSSSSFNHYDPLNFIAPGENMTQSMASVPSLPVPMSMFMNMTHIPPRFYNNQPGAQAGAAGQMGNGKGGPPPTRQNQR